MNYKIGDTIIIGKQKVLVCCDDNEGYDKFGIIVIDLNTGYKVDWFSDLKEFNDPKFGFIARMEDK